MLINEDNNWTQIGIVSFGQKCAEPGVPSVFTRVSKFVGWIEATMAAAVSAPPPPPPTPPPVAATNRPFVFPTSVATVAVSGASMAKKKVSMALPSNGEIDN